MRTLRQSFATLLGLTPAKLLRTRLNKLQQSLPHPEESNGRQAIARREGWARHSALASVLFLASAAQAEPPRAVSLDFCADQHLLALADHAQIAAVSPGADEDDSYLRERARGLRAARPNTEEIAALKPDVVLRFWGGSSGLTTALEKFGARVITLEYPSDFDVVKKNLRTAAEALDRKAEGERLVADLDARLAALAARRVPHPRALYVTPGGVTAADGTMIDAILRAAGVENAAAWEYGWPALPMEKLILDPPELIVAGFFEATTEYVNHWSASRHPAFRKVFAETPAVHLSADIISCPAWFSVEAAEEIVAALKDVPDAE